MLVVVALSVLTALYIKRCRPVKTSLREEAALEAAVLAASAGGRPATLQSLAVLVGAEPCQLVPVLDRLVRGGLAAVAETRRLTTVLS
ncbi:MAG: TrmB family transcriptional regulator [Pyrobaculum sp.]